MTAERQAGIETKPMVAEKVVLRRAVQAHAELQERVLKENDWKGGWENCELCELLGRALEEYAELLEEVSIDERTAGFVRLLKHMASEIERDFTTVLDRDLPPDEKQLKAIEKETADLGNFGVMIVDRMRHPETPSCPCMVCYDDACDACKTEMKADPAAIHSDEGCKRCRRNGC